MSRVKPFATAVEQVLGLITRSVAKKSVAKTKYNKATTSRERAKAIRSYEHHTKRSKGLLQARDKIGQNKPITKKNGRVSSSVIRRQRNKKNKK